ncbi:MAG: hypothetical protein DLM73_05790 [Chthoniobacterales bacterium]|nr:MAG: hypothetical protein DLM73_05790 [Chthoniobacterales bacterium]
MCIQVRDGRFDFLSVLIWSPKTSWQPRRARSKSGGSLIPTFLASALRLRVPHFSPARQNSTA